MTTEKLVPVSVLSEALTAAIARITADHQAELNQAADPERHSTHSYHLGAAAGLLRAVTHIGNATTEVVNGEAVAS